MNEVAGRIELQGMLEMNINANFTRSFFPLFFNFTSFLSSGIISILAGQKCIWYYTCACVYLYVQGKRISFL